MGQAEGKMQENEEHMKWCVNNQLWESKLASVYNCQNNNDIENMTLNMSNEWKVSFNVEKLWCSLSGEGKDQNFHSEETTKLAFQALAFCQSEHTVWTTVPNSQWTTVEKLTVQ